MSNVLYIVENDRSNSSLVNMRSIVESLNTADHKVYLLTTYPVDSADLPVVEKNFTVAVERQPQGGTVTSMDALWIAQGMSDIGNLTRVCAFYSTLVRKYRIDVIVADTAPLAQLFAYSKQFPIVTVQPASAMPPTLPYRRGLVSGSPVSMQDSLTLKTAINEYLLSKGVVEINDISDLYSIWGTHITTSYKVMDAFCLASEFTRALNYFPPLAGIPAVPGINWRKEDVPNVVIYADHNKRLVPGIITQLLLVDDANIVLVSSDDYILSQLDSDLRNKITCLKSSVVNLSDYIPSADFVICNANEITTGQAVKSGVPVLAIPITSGQHCVADWIVMNNLGMEIKSSLDVTQALSMMLTDLGVFSTSCQTYANANLTENGNVITELMSTIGSI